ncbi:MULTISPECIES: hypothetical protein [Moraxella]|uniref:Uncharacterized protein n=1 Tax=Moraxella catarrhalis TaxID=480 RepID=A0A7Z0UYZ2_MORCA|nr:hypothetical protein [Moraxella catarrhalis]OAV01120.1 hypothetical protein AO382_0877 [Moraxella catarrhalis]
MTSWRYDSCSINDLNSDAHCPSIPPIKAKAAQTSFAQKLDVENFKKVYGNDKLKISL